MSKNNIENSLFTEKYRPSNLAEFIGNDIIKEKFQKYIDQNDMPHLLFHGRQGVGKTSVAKILANQLEADVLYINAADENNMEVMRTKIKDFASSMGFNKWRIVILDEASFILPNAQAILLNTIELFSASCRFILTTNYVERIVPPLQSRCTIHQISPPSKKEVAKRVVEILETESIEFQMEDLAKIINASYPDIRAIINVCQDNVIGNKLSLQEETLRESNYPKKIMECLLSKNDGKTKYSECRQILANSKVRTFDELYSYLYQNIDEFDHSIRGDVILFMAEFQYKDSFVVDKEINTMALLINIIRTI